MSENRSDKLLYSSHVKELLERRPKGLKLEFEGDACWSETEDQYQAEVRGLKFSLVKHKDGAVYLRCHGSGKMVRLKGDREVAVGRTLLQTDDTVSVNLLLLQLDTLRKMR